MFHITPRNIHRVLADAGLTLPAQAAQAYATLEALDAARNADPAAEASAAAHDLTPHNARKRLTALAHELTARGSHEQAYNVLSQPVAKLFFDAIREATDDLIAALVPAFDKAAAIVQTAAAHFPSDAPKDQILDAGDESVAAYRQLDGALATLGKIRSARVSLAELAGQEQHVTWFVERIENGERMAQAERAFAGTGNALHNLAAQGFRLRLNTTSEAKQVAQGAALADSAARAAAQESAAKKLRDSMPWLATKQ